MDDGGQRSLPILCYSRAKGSGELKKSFKVSSKILYIMDNQYVIFIYLLYTFTLITDHSHFPNSTVHLNKGRIRWRKERDGLCLSSSMPKWASNPNYLYGYNIQCSR